MCTRARACPTGRCRSTSWWRSARTSSRCRWWSPGSATICGAGTCTIAPKVEAASRNVSGTSWSVAGLGRGDVGVVTMHDGGPAYGGTPSDAAVLAAIADLKARRIGVTLYPIVLMDIAEGNPLG